MVQTKLFKSNQSQAVRLPKPVALPEEIKEVRITVIGNSRLISPVDQSWDVWFEEAGVSEDFMVERDQSEARERESL